MIVQVRRAVEAAGPRNTRLRGWDLRCDEHPERTEREWAALIKATWKPMRLPERYAAYLERQGITQHYEKQNTVTDPGMETLAAILAGALAAWQNGRWYAQALGTSNTSSESDQRGLIKEIHRKALTEHSYVAGTRVNNCLTVFVGADFTSAQTLVEASPAPTTTIMTVTSSTGFAIGDTVRIGLSTGYEFRTILDIVGNVVTLSLALSVAPVGAETFDQVVDEAGLFGDLPASYTTGTVTVTSGSPTVTGAGTAWIGKVAAGDYFRLASERTWYEIDTVADTELTLTGNYVGSTTAGLAYKLRGTCFNRGTGLQYVKLPGRGMTFENQWTMGGV